LYSRISVTSTREVFVFEETVDTTPNRCETHQRNVSPKCVIREDCEKIRETTISDYWFAWNKAAGTTAICLGFGSLYNHSSTEPNAVFDQDLSDRTISIYALKTIEPDDEIIMNYNQRTGDRRKWHFETKPSPTTTTTSNEAHPSDQLAPASSSSE
jgi:hypothetical protein